MPIITCSHKRAGKVAPTLTSKGFCATKNLHYFGAKLHVLGFRRPGTLPLPDSIGLSPASMHDLKVMRPILSGCQDQNLFLDKAYCDNELAQKLANQRAVLYTPVKKKPHTPLLITQIDLAADTLLSTAVSRLRQPIESLFNWLHQKTGIQNASFVRSEAGLLTHVFGKMAAALVLWLNF